MNINSVPYQSSTFFVQGKQKGLAAIRREESFGF
jgi:hypothetical protein